MACDTVGSSHRQWLNGLRPMLSVSEKLARYGSTLLSQMGYLSRGVN